MENESKPPVMDCQAAAQSISALHDGEPIAREAAEHIASCAICQQVAREYAEMRADLRLLAARTAPQPAELAALPPPAAPGAKRSTHFLAMLSGRTLIPRAVAAMAALIIIALSISLALVVHAQVDGPWVQFAVYLNLPHADGERMTGIVQSPDMPRGTFIMRGPTETVAYSLRTVEIRDGKAHIEVGVRGVPPSVDDRAARELVASMPPTGYWITPGQALEIPVEGIGSLRLEARISETQPAVWDWTEKPVAERELRLNRPLVLRGKEVILEGAGGTISVGVEYGGALEYYVPGEGLFVISLAPFPNAIEGAVDGSLVQFDEAGVVYRIFSRRPITGGDQPRPIWIRHDSRDLVGYL